MVDLAQTVMSAAQVWISDEPSSIPNPMLKIIHNPQKALLRIGLWPIISASESEIGIGMGIGVVLAALLEQWPSVSVYRLMTQVSDMSSDFQWKIEDTQFSVDDWELDGLDENVAIWGSFALEDDLVNLTLTVEDDSREDDSMLELKHESATLVEMLNHLPILASKIMNWFNEKSAVLQNPYTVISATDEALTKNFLEDIFLWELDYFLELWGQGSNSDQVLKSQENLIELSNELNCDFSAWITSGSIARFVLFDETNWSKWLLPTVKETASLFNEYPVAAVILAATIFRLNDHLQAFDILETSLLLHPEYTGTWAALGALYEKSGEDLSAIDVYQRAIELDAATAEIFSRYALLMDSLADHQVELREGANRVSAAGRPFVERYIFTDSTADASSLRESCAAYRYVVELDASNLEALSHLVIGLLFFDDDEAWSFCTQLVSRDKDGTVITSVIEQLMDDDLPRMIDILQTAALNAPLELNVHMNLARAYLAARQNERAKSALNTLVVKDVSPTIQASIARLRLAADEPDFEIKIGEINDSLDAKSQVPSEEIEFLEACIEKEPLFSEGYRLLAQSYLSWNEPDDALEVLLDGQKIAPFDSDLIALLANVLWDADEPELALACLDQGLNINSQNATLLSLMGRFLFDNGEDDTAKEYLRRAEVADPLNSELSATRFYIANTLIKNKKSQ
jgi:tetratricopeptide (TPR) repeat protein